MDPAHLAAKISEFHDEPDKLTAIRQEAAKQLPEELAAALETVIRPTNTDRRDISDKSWNRLQDKKNESTTIQPLNVAIQNNPALLDDLPTPTTPIQTFCQAFFTNGIHLHIKEQEDAVLQTVFNEFALPRIDFIVIKADRTAGATTIEGCSAPRSRPFKAGYTLIDANNEADIRHNNLQNWKNTLLLDATRSTGNATVNHFINADTKIIDIDAPSHVLTPEQAFQTTACYIVDEIKGDYNELKHTTETLHNLPNEYKKEISHILKLRD